MKTTEVIRQLDALGRIVLPIELRRTLGIGSKDMVEILVEGNSVILRKYETSCLFCGGTRGLTHFRDKVICSSCMKELKNL